MNNIIDVIGYTAAFFGAVTFLPQVVKVLKSKSTKDISTQSYLLLSLTSVLWTTYGLLKSDMPIFSVNAIILLCALIILSMKARHG